MILWKSGLTNNKITLISFQGACQSGLGIVGAFRGTIPCEKGTLLSPVATNAFDFAFSLSGPPDDKALFMISFIPWEAFDALILQ